MYQRSGLGWSGQCEFYRIREPQSAFSSSQVVASEAVLLEPSTHESPLQVEDSLLRLTGDFAQVTVFNPSGCSSSMETGAELGEASTVELIQPEECPSEDIGELSPQDSAPPIIKRVTEETERRQKKLSEDSRHSVI